MLILKLDFHKAFDTINWECLLYVLQHRGFDNRWTDWIRSILSASKAHILINGVVSTKFNINEVYVRGTLSLYIFSF